MTTKKKDIPTLVCFLVKSKDEVKKMLEDRITLGNELVAVNVTTTQNSPYRGYTSSYKMQYDDSEKDAFFAKYNKWHSYNSALLSSFFNIPDNKYTKEYEETSQFWGLPKEDIVKEQKKTIGKEITCLESIIERLPIIPSSNENLNSNTIPSLFINNNKVFIVHGHDRNAETETARFIESLGLEAIILHEQANKGNTIIEKIEDNSDVGYGIVLYTPCDVGAISNDSTNLKPRARQNVVFEHGYLIAKIGRSHVCALVKESVETPGDISGVIYIKMDDNGMWKYQIAKEMGSVGYQIDLNKIK